MQRTKIAWCEYTWNPITGCTPSSDGCLHCYARKMAQRLKGRFGYPRVDPFRPGVVHEDQFKMMFPASGSIFVCSMGDLFHPHVKDFDIRRVFNRMMREPQCQKFVLTKHAGRMVQFMRTYYSEGLPNHVMLGVSIEHSSPVVMQRLDALVAIQHVRRFVSVEPMLGSVDLSRYLDALDWVVCGPETGPKRRPCHEIWIRVLCDQCVSHGVPFFLKKRDGIRWGSL